MWWFPRVCGHPCMHPEASTRNDKRSILGCNTQEIYLGVERATERRRGSRPIPSSFHARTMPATAPEAQREAAVARLQRFVRRKLRWVWLELVADLIDWNNLSAAQRQRRRRRRRRECCSGARGTTRTRAWRCASPAATPRPPSSRAPSSSTPTRAGPCGTATQRGVPSTGLLRRAAELAEAGAREAAAAEDGGLPRTFATLEWRWSADTSAALELEQQLSRTPGALGAEAADGARGARSGT